MAKTDCDVAVVGGGFAGLTAARDLRKEGVDVVLLEARDRLGGRTFTQPRGDMKVELGGTWVHWFQPHVWREIRRYGLSIAETPGAPPDRVIYQFEGKRHEVPAEDFFAELYPALDHYFEDSRLLWERPYDAGHSWEMLASHDGTTALERLAALDLSPRNRMLLEGLLETLGQAQANELSYVEMSRVYALSGYRAELVFDTTARYKLVDGTEALIEAMIADGGPTVRKESAVRRVEQSGRRVQLVVEGGDNVAAHAAVIALPLNVLKDVAFAPALSDHKLQASRETHAGAGFKVFIEVKGPLENLMTLGTSAISPLSFTGTYAQKGDNTLLFGFGIGGAEFDTNDREAVEKALRVYLPDVDVVDCWGHGWTSDPYAQGTWCSYRPGQLVRYGRELEQSEGRLVFAGADICEGWRGFIDGAIGSGTRAAREILDLLV